MMFLKESIRNEGIFSDKLLDDVVGDLTTCKANAQSLDVVINETSPTCSFRSDPS
jgi:hypothetical protein